MIEYAEALGVDLSFQGFAEELATFPGDYGRPGGCLMLAMRTDHPVRCAALRPLSATVGERKRLYVRPAERGSGIARAITLTVMAAAREYGYVAFRLDTLPAMAAARALYRSLGFQEIPAYRENPIVGTQFLECLL